MTKRASRSVANSQPDIAQQHFGDDDFGNAGSFDTTVYPALGLPEAEAVPVTQVVFIEGSVADAKQLARGVAPGVIAVILSPDQDGMQQIAAWLASHDVGSLAAIDIVADGQDGVISLGTATLNAATIAQYQSELAAIGAALLPGGAIQIYGCDVAQDAAGDAFLQQISAAAGGASVAGASHLVGAAAGGGSWNLDFNTGTIDASAPFTQAAMSAYTDELGVANNGVFVFTQGSTADATTAVVQLNVNATGSVASSSTVIADTSTHEYLVLPFSLAIDAPLNKYFVTDTNPNTGVSNILMGTIGSTSLGTILFDSDFNNSAIDDLALDQPTGNLYYTVVSYGSGNGAAEAPGIYKINISNLTGTVAFPGTSVALFTDGGFQNPNPLALDLTQNSIFFGNWLEDTDGNNYSNQLEVANPVNHTITDLTSQLSATLRSHLTTTANASDSDSITGIAVVPNGSTGGTLYYVLNLLVQVNNVGTDSGYIEKISYSYNGSAITLLPGTASTLFHSTTTNYNGIAVDPTNGLLYVGGTSTSGSGTFVESVNGGTPTQIYADPIINGVRPTAFSAAFLSQPTIVATGTINYNAGAAATKLYSPATVSNPDGTNLSGVTISIASGFSAGDTLTATTITGIAQSYAAGVLTLTGNVSAAQYQTEVDSVAFASTSTVGGTRTINWTATNGLETSATAVSAVAVHTAPTITAGATVTFTGGGSPAVLDNVLAITDSSGTVQTSATVTIGNFLSTDTLIVGLPGSLASSFSNGVLTLTGTATTATYKTALDSVTFSENPSNSDPTGRGAKSSHAITYSINNGFVQSAGATSTVNLVHTAPTIVAGATATFSGGGLPVSIDPGLTVTDPDSGGVLSSATVTIGSPITGDTLNFTNTGSATEGNIAVASNSGGVLVLTSSGSTATLAQWQTALDSVTYSVSPSNTDPTGGGTHLSRTITYSVNDGAASSAAATSTLKTVHTAPTITAGATVAFTGGSSTPVVLDAGLVLTDSDSGGNISNATITLGGSIAGDKLNFTNTANIVGTYTNGVLTLTGIDTVAHYQAALEAVTYSFSPSTGDPTGGGTHTSRTITWSANDGVASSAGVTSTLNTVHVAPTVTAGSAITYVIGNAPGTLDSTLTLSDPDSGGLIQSATVSVAGGAGLGDTLATSTTGTPSITASYNAANETLTLTGSDTLADYQAALRFTTITGTTPGTRTINYIVNDGAAASSLVTSSATLQAVPTIAASGTVTYNQGGTTPVLLDSGLTVTDASATQLTSATVTVGNYLTGDTLSVGTPGGLNSSFSSGTLTLSGTASIATYKTALDSVGYLFTPSTADPTSGGTDSTRPITYTVTDANGNTSPAASSTLNTHVPPSVTAGGSAMFTEDGAAVPLDSGLTITDPDSTTLTGATVSISSGFLSGDTLSFTAQAGITGNYNATTGVLSFTGSASIAAYQTLLDSVKYGFTGDPSAGGTDYNRTITWSVTDGMGTSTPATSSLTVTCFRAGTLINTPAGDVPVEHLAVGDRVRTASGAVRPIVWIGIGRVLCTRGRRTAATPVIVEKSALGPNLPHKDLYITKAHALHIDDVLIPVEFLVNHRSIRWDDRAQEVTLYHIELETHDVLLANGAPAESYRDDGNRWLFRNANSGWGLPPQAPCAPVVTGGPKVDAAWRRLLVRAWGNRKLPSLTDDPDLHLVVDGKRIDPVTKAANAHVFRLAAVPAQVRIVSRDAVPSEFAIARDERALGVALRRIAIRQGAQFKILDARDVRLVGGFHSYETATGLRWTDGDAALPPSVFAGFDGPLEIVLQVAAVTQYLLLAEVPAREAA